MSAQVFDFDAALPGLLYWDASFLVHATYPAGRYHQECYGFLERLSIDPRIRLVGTEREDMLTALELMDNYALGRDVSAWH